MFESWVSERKNFHLRNALLLRKSGDYPNALKELNIAADVDKDGEACWFKGHAYYMGGFGLYRNEHLSNMYFTQSNELGCDWLSGLNNVILPEDDRNPEYCYYFGSYTYRKYAAECGSSKAQYLIGDCTNEWLDIACKQKNHVAMSNISFCFTRGCTYHANKYNVLDIARMNTEGVFEDTICYCLTNERDSRLRLQELYIYGQFLSKNPLTLNNLQITEAVNVYTSTFKKAQKACMYWLWFSKSFMIRDLRQMIGQMIWESRTRPEEWKIENENNKKQKCSKGL